MWRYKSPNVMMNTYGTEEVYIKLCQDMMTEMIWKSLRKYFSSVTKSPCRTPYTVPPDPVFWSIFCYGRSISTGGSQSSMSGWIGNHSALPRADLAPLPSGRENRLRGLSRRRARPAACSYRPGGPPGSASLPSMTGELDCNRLLDARVAQW